jgi:predicted transcriptional regulator
MTKQEFKTRIKLLRAKGEKMYQIAEKLGYDRSSLSRATRENWKGDSSKVISKFESVYK